MVCRAAIFLLFFNVFSCLKDFVIIVPSFNNKKWYEWNINSIFSQDYPNYRVIYIDDCSTDKTHELVKKKVENSDFKNRFTIIKNQEHKGALFNIWSAIQQCRDDEIIINLDGDDWFAHDYVLHYLNTIYQDKNIWMTYGQFVDWPENEIGWGIEYPKNIVKKNRFREFGFFAPQLRTYYAWLAKKIKLRDLLNGDSEFFDVSGDVALMFPMFEMAGERHKFITKILCNRNVKTELNDHKLMPDKQVEVRDYIITKKKYKRLNNVPTKNQKNDKVDIIIFSFDRPMQLYALAESIEKYLKNYGQVFVLCKSSSNDFLNAYRKVENRFKFLKFVFEDPKKNFKQNLFIVLDSLQTDYIMFAVDDIIIKDAVDLSYCAQLLEKTDAYGFYLRLGKNINYCYYKDKPQKYKLKTQIFNGVWVWKFEDAMHDWAYSNSVDMTIFKRDKLLKRIKNIKFENPNQFEYKQHFYFNNYKKRNGDIGLCFTESKIINIPVNLVQKDHLSRHSNLYSTEDLLGKFNKNLKIDIKKYERIINNSPHADYPLFFHKI